MMSNSSVSTVTGFINGTKWLDMPLDEAFKFAQVYVNKLPNKAGFSMDLGSGRAILEKWIDDNWKEVALVLEKVINKIFA